MKKFYTLCTATALAATLTTGAMAAVPSTPEVEGFIYYTGDTFTAYWGSVENADKYILNVFSKSGEDVEKSVRFNSLTAPENWTYTSNGLHTGPDNQNHLLIENDGDGVYFFSPNGVIEDFTISGLSIGFNDDDITDANSCHLKIDLYDNSGYNWFHVETSGYAFAKLPSINLPQALGEWPENVAGVRISCGRTADQTKGKIALTSATYKVQERDYVLSNYETADNIELVDGLDPEQVYYYYVAAKNEEGTSNPSDIVKVDGFLPVSATYNNNVTESSYTAEWDPVPKALVYYIDHYKLIPSTDTNQLNLFKDTFSGSKEGTVDQPVSVESLDGLTDMTGWSGQNMIAANGMIGAGAGSYTSAYLDTPRMDLSANGGTFNVRVKAKGTPGDKLTIWNQGKYEWDIIDGQFVTWGFSGTVIFGEDGWVDETVEITRGDEFSYLTFEAGKTDGSKDQDPFLLEEVTVSVPGEGAAYDRVFLTRKYTEGKENTSYTFTGLEAGNTYGFEVQAAKFSTQGEEETSAKSTIHIVTLLGQAAIQLPGIDGTVAWNNGALETNFPEATSLNVYDLSGRLIYAGSIPAGHSVTAMDLTSGIYLLRVGNKTVKIAI